MADFSHSFDPTTLREYDIRGIVGKTLHEADAFAIGRVFGSIVAATGGRTVAVGYDGRLSSPVLEPELVPRPCCISPPPRWQRTAASWSPAATIRQIITVSR